MTLQELLLFSHGAIRNYYPLLGFKLYCISLLHASIDVVVEFNPDVYTGREGDRAITFTVVLRTPSSRTVQVLFSTEPLTAMSKCS